MSQENKEDETYFVEDDIMIIKSYHKNKTGGEVAKYTAIKGDVSAIRFPGEQDAIDYVKKKIAKQ